MTGGYGDTQILHRVSLDVGIGEVVVIIGPNGAGKSTVMKAVLGLVHLIEGEILLDGRSITHLPPEQIVRQGVCYVPQVRNVFPSLTVEENLEMGAFVRQDDHRPRLAEIYQLFPPLAQKRRQATSTLSGGQRQMVAMGRALMLEPRILLLDEPTAGLSPKFRAEIFNIIQTINQTDTPILMVEQNAKQALTIADRGYVLVDGKNALTGTGDELLSNTEVAQTFLGRRTASPSSLKAP